MKQIVIMLFILPVILFAQPYVFSGGKDNTIHIIASKVLKKAYAKADIEMTAIFMPLEESLQNSNRGQTDGELARLSEVEKLYPNLRKIPVAIASVEAIIFSKNSDLNIKHWNDLKGHDLTIIQGAKCIELRTKGMKKKRRRSRAGMTTVGSAWALRTASSGRISFRYST